MIGVRGYYSGDGGPATAAQFSSPSFVLADDTGNIYISDRFNNVIVKVDTLGIIKRIAGIPATDVYSGTYSGDDGLAILADINGPVGMVFDKEGNLFFSDMTNRRIRKIDKKGVITTFAGNGIPGYSGDGGLALDAQFELVNGLAFDTKGNLFLVDNFNMVVRKISKAGIITNFAGNNIEAYSGDGGPATEASLNQPLDIAIDSLNNVYISDRIGSVVRIVTPDGIINPFAGTPNELSFGGDGGLPTSAYLNRPAGIFLGKTGMYIADANNNRIRFIGPPPLLPLKLISFTGSMQGDKALLQWQTSNEINISRFELESSIDGVQFKKINTASANNATATSSYNYTDVSLADITGNTVYYRLKMIDRDGKLSYSAILRLSLGQLKSSLRIFPNPVKNVLNIHADIITKENYQLSLFDIAGKQIFQKNYQLIAGSNLLSLPVDQLASGTYLLVSQSAGGEKKVEKFIKE